GDADLLSSVLDHALDFLAADLELEGYGAEGGDERPKTDDPQTQNIGSTHAEHDTPTRLHGDPPGFPRVRDPNLVADEQQVRRSPELAQLRVARMVPDPR